MLKRSLTTLALTLLPAIASARMPRTALVVEARLGTGTFAGGGASITAVPSLLMGVRLIDRLQLGVGIGFFRFATSSATGDAATNAFTLIPNAAVDVMKAADNRVAWYVKAGLPMGGLFYSQPGTSSTSHFVIGYDFGTGVRWAPHEMFALGVEAGLFGLFASQPNQPERIGQTAFYGALVGTFYWDFTHGR